MLSTVEVVRYITKVDLISPNRFQWRISLTFLHDDADSMTIIFLSSNHEERSIRHFAHSSWSLLIYIFLHHSVAPYSMLKGQKVTIWCYPAFTQHIRFLIYLQFSIIHESTISFCCDRFSLVIRALFHLVLYWKCNYLSMIRLKTNLVNTRGPSSSPEAMLYYCKLYTRIPS